jgi:hypothetical protein
MGLKLIAGQMARMVETGNDYGVFAVVTCWEMSTLKSKEVIGGKH